ncbi:PEP-CTERM sorting domain-containing protein [Aeoliella mucimassa]|uniref:Ice-binding protein C-terminal domain-containing protein n=1 Tax=Aeoliella mucimassa TaxID=2527972 RepID=A0A518AVM3_9BACT|nr:PEP-CTERM sorting domain-containing protein [Aeoliella mucimassa]QDU58758.1 hypothetical protein Pan181_49980 [Aeoliella mucimassa]
MIRTQIGTTLAACLLVGFCFSQRAQSAAISVNFNNTTAENWSLQPTDTAGPLGSANWNNTSTASGGPQSLVDDLGDSTSASITWSSANTWANGDNNGNGDRILLHPYLDDGGTGVSVTVEDVPYAKYRVYGIISSDQNGNDSTYTTGDFMVNGAAVLGGTAIAASDYDYAENNFAGDPWQRLTTSQIGNFWVSDVQTASTLSIAGPVRSGDERGSLSGIIIESVPEPASLVVFGLATMSLLFVRRR